MSGAKLVETKPIQKYRKCFTVKFDLNNVTDDQMESHLKELDEAWLRAEQHLGWLKDLMEIIKQD